MKKINTAPISGTQELLPADQFVFDQLKTNIMKTYASYGFQHIETPVIDRTEILLAKAGGETEKQIYKVVKTQETTDSATQALRFDHTVPLARYLAEYQSQLNFPFKVTQIGRNFRGERAQKGRFREFYQCDIDIIGRNELPVTYDAEVIRTLLAALDSFNLPALTVRISNRKLLTGLLTAFGLASLSDQIFSIIDHIDKVDPVVTHQQLEKLGLGSSNIKLLERFLSARGNFDTVQKQLLDLNISHHLFISGLFELETVSKLLSAQGLTNFIIDPSIIRGLDYYTGTVFETFINDYPSLGSICSGGRYDNLISQYSTQNFPGVGGSIGLTRLFYVLNQHNLVKKQTNPLDYVIIPLSPDQTLPALQLADQLRRSGSTVDTLLNFKKLGDQLKFAAKIANHAVVLGPDEVQAKVATAKNLLTGEQTTITL